MYTEKEPLRLVRGEERRESWERPGLWLVIGTGHSYKVTLLWWTDGRDGN